VYLIKLLIGESWSALNGVREHWSRTTYLIERPSMVSTHDRGSQLGISMTGRGKSDSLSQQNRDASATSHLRRCLSASYPDSSIATLILSVKVSLPTDSNRARPTLPILRKVLLAKRELTSRCSRQKTEKVRFCDIATNDNLPLFYLISSSGFRCFVCSPFSRNEFIHDQSNDLFDDS